MIDLGVSEGLRAIGLTGLSNKITGGGAGAFEIPVNVSGGKIQPQVLGASTERFDTRANNTQLPLNSSNPTAKPTSGSGNKGTSSTKSKLSGDDGLAKLKKSIGSQFDDIIGTYKGQINELPGQQQSLLASVGQMAQTQKSTITDALNNVLAKLGNQRNEVQTQQKQTLQDLADNTRNLFQAGNVYLGTRGAGDSSATGMYSAALTQNANKERAGVQRDVNSMYNDIGLKEADTKTTFQAQLNEVDTWQQSQEQNIVMQFTDLKRQLESALANAKGQEKANLANLQKDLYTQAKNQLYNIQMAASQAKNSLQSGVQTGSGLGTMGAGQVAQAGTYQVGQVYQPGQVDISGLQDVGYGNEAMLDTVTGNFWKKNEDGTLQYLGNQNQ